jgi:hypothetical protein
MKSDASIISETKYQWLVKWGRSLGSFDYYIANQVVKAEKSRAPFDAIYQKQNGEWVRLQDCCEATQKELGFVCI